MSLVVAEHTELCVFSDASTKAIGVVAYLKTIQQDGQTEVGFVMEELDQAMHVVLQATQRSAFAKELAALKAQKTIPKSSCLQQLSPIIEDKLIHVGGRLRHSNLGTDERHPIILPKDSHVSLLLTRHHHQQVKHQGRHITEGAVRAAGLWGLGWQETHKLSTLQAA
ncbi:hypothetical protein SKAU_G00129390 [Synaphobranchus kaupii]|uniref:Uncharacterized protein n=1 Tax=Synaphobranchus kaupii TaxID=118154 RepID=A0A9Q1FQ97_SYNKA|nr:hypothetical protein SKAU_G00129390 [Synaphobranchus kaupii]